jgi:undecaprenyl-diphosphatase
VNLFCSFGVFADVQTERKKKERLALDYRLFQYINGLAGHNAVQDHVFEALSSYGPYVCVLVVVIMALRPATRLAAVFGFVSPCVAMAVNFLIGVLYNRPRPFVTHHVHLLLPHDPNASFPSDHTAGAVAIAMALWFFSRKAGVPMFLLALLIGFSRIYVGHHYPTDVLGGLAVGVVSAIIVHQAGTKLVKRYLPSMVKEKEEAA